MSLYIFDNSDVEETERIANTYIQEKLSKKLSKADDYLSIIDIFIQRILILNYNN